MSVRNLDRLFSPRSVALFDASPQPGSIGGIAERNLRRAGFTGELMLVGPARRSADDPPAYRDAASLPYPPDLAVIASPLETVPSLIREIGERGTRAAVVLSAGFGELGSRQTAVQQAILDAAKPHLLRVMGPDCVGIMVPQRGLDASFSHLPARPGDIAFISRSGAILTAMLDWAVPRGIGFSYVVSLGEMADVDVADVLDFLATDPHTRAILLYIEDLADGRKFMSAARAAARSKPVLVLKAGRNRAGTSNAALWAGAFAGSDAAYDAAFRRAGILRVDTMAELFDAAETLAATREQIGDRLAILTNSRGAGVLAADALTAAGGCLAALSGDAAAAWTAVRCAAWGDGNPVDIGAGASGERYAEVLAALIRDREVDAILVLNCPTALASSEECARAVVDTAAAAGSAALHGRNLITAWLGEHSAHAARQLFAGARIACYETPDSAVGAFMHRIRHRRHRELLMETPLAQADSFAPDRAAAARVIAKAISDGRSWLDPEAVAAVLAAYGIPLAAGRRAAEPDQAAELAAAIGFPVALKILPSEIAHKSEIGGVALNLGGADQVRCEARAMLERAKTAHSGPGPDGFWLQPAIRRHGAVELRVGIVEDPVFGPLVAFGQGGGVANACDNSLELPPLNGLLARRLIARTRISTSLRGDAGSLPANVDAIVDVLIRLGQLAADCRELRELDLNPVLADASGVIVLAAWLRVAPRAAGKAARLAIAPYPQHLASIERLRDGTRVEVRPLRPEDEAMLDDLAAHMSQEDLRLRFFTPMQGLTRAVAARLSQLDYDRELGLFALRDGTALGVAHFFADPDNRRAEYAIAVRTDWKGRGLGYLLMDRLIGIARQRGIGELVGEVLRENLTMLQMCRELGFTITMQPADPAVMLVKKTLAVN